MNYILKNFLLFTFLFCITFGFSQNQLENPEFEFKNTINLEILGHGGFYSLNFERVILNGKTNRLSSNIGLALYPENIDILPLFVPVSINYISSLNNNHFEFGIGQVLINDAKVNGDNDYKMLGSAKIGYRYQKPKGRFVYKAIFTPYIDIWDNYNTPIIGRSPTNFYSWGGLSVGYNF